MNFFKDKINRARLLDLTVVNRLHGKSKFYDGIKKFVNEEEFNNIFKNGFTDEAFITFFNYIKNLENRKNIINDDAYINNQEKRKIIRNYDVYIHINDLPESIKNRYNDFNYEELLQRIGDAGENAAYKYLIGEYQKKGFIQGDKKKNFNSIKLTKKIVMIL